MRLTSIAQYICAHYVDEFFSLRTSFCVIRAFCHFVQFYIFGEFKDVWRRLYTVLCYLLGLCPSLFFVHEHRNCFFFFGTMFCSLFRWTGFKLRICPKRLRHKPKHAVDTVNWISDNLCVFDCCSRIVHCACAQYVCKVWSNFSLLRFRQLSYRLNST